MNWQEEYDVIVVGSGAGGLVSAITAAYHGLRTVIIEKSPKWGGSSALSGGGLWIPNNHISKKAGLADSEEEALTYMNAVIGDCEASTDERKRAFVQNGPKMVKFLEDLGMKWIPAKLYPDYYPEESGGKIGRAIEAKIFDGRLLEDYLETLRTGDIEAPIPLYSGKVASLPKALTNVKDFLTVVGLFINGIFHKITKRKPLSIGAGLVGRLLKIALDHNVELKLSTSLKDVIIEDNQIVGVKIEKDRKEVLLKSKAVILAGGGFEHNEELRKKHHQIGSEWTTGSPDNTGDMLKIAEKHQLDIALLDDAWWGPTTVDHTGARRFLVYERSMPFSLIVDQTGERYFNESGSYTDAGQAMLARQKENGKAIHSWMIMDSRHRNNYLFSNMLPRLTPKEAIEKGFIIKADSIEELAEKCEINLEGLQETIERFNRFAGQGFDDDFERGNSAYDNYYGDPRYSNPNLGGIDKPPFYACKIFPGDLGTKGGIVTNEHGQALRNNEPINGLYATGNCSASVMGRVYPGPGATLGAATVFGYISANHIKETIS